jgi:polyisoprenoid-binding protein YceI
LIVLVFLFVTALAAGGYVVSGRVVYEARGPVGAFKGENPAVRGTLTWDAATRAASGRVCVDLTAWDSGEPLRDKHTRTMFETDTYPEGCFELSAVRAGAAPDEIVLLGNLTLHGVTRPLELPGKFREEGGKLYFEGYFETMITDWEMKRPSMMGLKVRDLVKVWVYGEGVAR